MMQEEDYMEFASEVLSKMRLVLEGAVTLFEDELCPVYKLIRESGECTAMLAFDDIGTALYLLKQYIIQLQEVHHRKAQRQTDTQKPIELQ